MQQSWWVWKNKKAFSNWNKVKVNWTYLVLKDNNGAFWYDKCSWLFPLQHKMFFAQQTESKFSENFVDLFSTFFKML